MPLFSEHISNMYYSGTPTYSSVPYSYTSSPYGTSYSASYLNPGGNYSNHSSLAPYTRTLSSRWLGRNYSPILSTISEKGTTSPVRINSPRRIHVNRTYTSHIPSSYTPRPININTADIDVSREKYRNKTSSQPSNVELRRQSPVTSKSNESSPRVGEKPNTGVDTSPGSLPKRSTIKRDRPVVRLHTVKRKDRDSPRQPVSASNNISLNTDNTDEKGKPEMTKWRERLADDLAYKNKKEKKTIGEKLVEKFTLKDKEESDFEKSVENEEIDNEPQPVATTNNNKSYTRRCSMEYLAEQASLLDSLIRRENLSTATLDLSKIGNESSKVTDEDISDKRKRKNSCQLNPLTTTKSDHSFLTKSPSKRKSLRKSTSGEIITQKGESLCNLDCISEMPIFTSSKNISSEPKRLSVKNKMNNSKSKQKLKHKITTSVEVTSPPSPLKFVVENVTVEEKLLPQKKKEIIYSSVIDDVQEVKPEKHPIKFVAHNTGNRKSIKIKTRPKVQKATLEDLASPDPDDGNFWSKIGKRETIYLMHRKKELEKVSEQAKRSQFWFPEDEEEEAEYKDQEDMDPSKLTRTADLKSKSVSNANIEPSAKTSKVNSSSVINVENKNNSSQNEVQKQMELHNAEINKVNIANKENVSSKNISSKGHTINTNHLTNKAKDDDLKINKVANKNEHVVCQIEGVKNQIQNNLPVDSKTVQYKNEKDIFPKEKETETSEVVLGEENVEKEPLKEINHRTLDTAIKETLPLQHHKNVQRTNTTSDEDLLNVNNVGIIKTESATYDTQCIDPNSKKHIDNQNELLSKTTEDNELKNLEQKDEEIPNDVVKSPTKEVVGEIVLKNEVNSQHDDNIPQSEIRKRMSVKMKTEDKKIELNLNKSIKQPSIKKPIQNTGLNLLFANKKPVKDVPAPKILIATPRPLQKKTLQVIHSSSSSETSSSEESSEEEDDESSESSAEFCESENNLDGRTSTGSNDSGFDSSAPASPSGFSYVRKDCDVNCHRKCEKLTANLCGVNQRLLVEALASRNASKRGADVPSTSSGSAAAQSDTYDIVQQDLEQSTAYELFKKTGKFTPPARSIPRFRKYTIDDFQFIKVLGKGSFGKVMLAELRETEYYYAVKCLKKDVVLEDDDVECTLIERKVLALGTNHPYLCHLFATFQTDSHLFFVMEYLNGGDLMFHIQQSGRFPEPRARFYAAEIVSGLKFLHKRGIVYRDLKLDNILLDFDGHVRIADFGMCKLQIYLDKTADTFCGTPDYMAPEIIKGLKYNQTVDWWSFGVLLYEMLIGQSPFSGCDEDELFWSICNEMPSYPRFLSTDSLSILTRLLDKDARTRLGGAECMHGDIRDQPFFQPIHWDKLERRELEAPFKPRVRHPLDTQYFDRAFTGERPRLTAVEPQVLRSMDQEPFRGFSYTNPNATDR